MIASLKNALNKRAAYNRTRHAIANLPLDIALDLDIHPGDANRIARQAVYG